MNTISLEQTVCRIDNKVLISPLDGELVMMDIENGSYHNINIVGTEIWEIIKNPTPVKDILKQLLQRFEVDEQQCLVELREFLSKLDEHHLIKLI